MGYSIPQRDAVDRLGFLVPGDMRADEVCCAFHCAGLSGIAFGGAAGRRATHKFKGSRPKQGLGSLFEGIRADRPQACRASACGII
jgi:hypothetical protein